MWDIEGVQERDPSRVLMGDFALCHVGENEPENKRVFQRGNPGMSVWE